MAKLAIKTFSHRGQYLSLTGVAVRKMLSAELVRDELASSIGEQSPNVPKACMQRWTDLSATLATAAPLEGYMILGCRQGEDGNSTGVRQVFLAAGRATSKEDAARISSEGSLQLFRILSETLEYVEFDQIEDDAELAHAVDHLKARDIVEIRRRREKTRLDQGVFGNIPEMGFGTDAKGKNPHPVEVYHLFPWIPSDDSWWRLAMTLAQERKDAALVVHWFGLAEPSAICQEQAGKALADTETAMGRYPDHILQMKVQSLIKEMLLRVSVADNPGICARVFLSCSSQASGALTSIVQNSLDDASIMREEIENHLYWKGGARFVKAGVTSVLTPFAPAIEYLFGPKEASAIIRTPMPTDIEIAGFPVVRCRTAPLQGNSGKGCLLGINRFRGDQREVFLDQKQRCRHTYIVGQTGTGKSNLMLHMALHDIEQGLGVAVLDPHGTLIEDILVRFPKKRKEDLVILDVTDIEYPVGFNILRIEENDPRKYVARRDLLIDELYTYMKDLYDKDTSQPSMGPLFETHFRGMLGLLMGMKEPEPPLVPSLLALRLIYRKEKIMRNMVKRVKDMDFILEEFVEEALRTGGEWKIENIAPYITCKFSRFYSDHALRAMTCQNRVLDIDSIVKEGKVLLFYLGKGVIGENAAGLLASQVVSRIRRAVISRGAKGQQKQFSLFADEFQIFADETFSELLAEGRKFGLALTIAHQYANQIPDDVLRAVLGNVGTTILFRVGPQDQGFFQPVFSPEFTGRDLVSLPNYRAYVRGSGPLGQSPFNLDVYPPNAGTDAAFAKELREYARKRYGRPRQYVEEEISMIYKAFLKLAEEG